MERYSQNNNDYQIQTRTHQRRQHLVVPVIMMVEGVHSGSHGPILHLASELGRFVESWNGIPVVINHPEEDGQNVSANSPTVLDREIVGRVFNAHMDGDRLKAEAWLDVERMQEISPLALAHIRARRPLDVSVGVFSDEDTKPGEHNGEQYEAVARNHRPDHLALLPGGVGACSWEDGCGVRSNEKGGMSVDKKELNSTLKALTEHGLAAVLISNELGYRAVSQQIQSQLDAMDDGSKMHFLQEVFNDNFIYEIRSTRGGEPTLLKRGYTIATDDTVTFAENPVEVRRRVEYETLSATMKRTKFNNNSKKEVTNMSDKKVDETKPCCEDVVNALIANEGTKYTAEDKEWLLTLKEDQLAKMIPEKAKAPIVNVEEKEPEKKEETPQANAEKVVEAFTAKLKTEEDFLKIMPESMRDQMRSAMALHAGHKAAMVKEILANTGDTWTEDLLKVMETDQLTRLYKSVKPTDYTLLGANTVDLTNNEVEPLMVLDDGRKKTESKKE